MVLSAWRIDEITSGVVLEVLLLIFDGFGKIIGTLKDERMFK